MEIYRCKAPNKIGELEKELEELAKASYAKLRCVQPRTDSPGQQIRGRHSPKAPPYLLLSHMASLLVSNSTARGHSRKESLSPVLVRLVASAASL